jgi:putative membrane protein
MDVLVLCIDRDDDLGRKGGVRTPVLGRQANIDAALRLGMADPEDSDVNTIFGGIKVLDEILASGKTAEIASIAGDLKVGLVSDSKLASQLDELLAELRPASVVVVSDGVEDEAILPIIQSRVRVDGVRRVLVKQSPNLESTYYLLKQVFNDPKISHTFFVPPALALLIFSLFSLLGYPSGAVVAITGAVGLYLLFRGLGLDDSMEEAKQTLRKSLYAGKIAFITYILGGMLVVIATVRGIAYFWQYYHEPIAPGYFMLMMIYLNASIWWYIAAALCVNLGKIMDMYLEGIRDARTISYFFFLLATGLIIWSASSFILASNADIKFEIGMVESVQYLAISAITAILITVVGVNISKRMAGAETLEPLQPPQDNPQSTQPFRLP